MAPERPEPIFNAPWPALLAAASILIPTALLMRANEATILSLALVPRDFWQGQWTGVVTMMFASKGLWGIVRARIGGDLLVTRRLPPGR